MTIPKPQPMKYHAPGWSLEHGGCRYQVWGPGEITHDGTPMGRFRDHWASNWSNRSGSLGAFLREDSLEEVLKTFPLTIREVFREVIGS